MKTIYNYLEVARLIEQDQEVVFTCHPVARITALQKARSDRINSDSITVTIVISIGDTHIGIIEQEYLAIGDLLDAFQIDDNAEIWEVPNE